MVFVFLKRSAPCIMHLKKITEGLALQCLVFMSCHHSNCIKIANIDPSRITHDALCIILLDGVVMYKIIVAVWSSNSIIVKHSQVVHGLKLFSAILLSQI